MRKKKPAPRVARTHSSHWCGNSANCRTSTTTVVGSTIRFGRIPRSMSIAESTVSAMTNRAETKARAVTPKWRKQAAASAKATAAVTTSGTRRSPIALGGPAIGW